MRRDIDEDAYEDGSQNYGIRHGMVEEMGERPQTDVLKLGSGR